MSDLVPLLTAPEVARLLRVHRKTVYEWATKGLLPVVRVGDTVRFREEDIAAVLEGEGELK